MKILLAIANPELRPEAAWLLDSLFSTAGPDVTWDVCATDEDLPGRVDHETVLLTWGKDALSSGRLPRRPAVEIHIAADEAFQQSPVPPVRPPREFEFEKLSALSFFGGGPIARQDTDGMTRWIIKGDILATAFCCLSRLEEWGRGRPLDPFDRFPDADSYLVRHGLETRPVVDEIRAMLDALIAAAWRPVPRRSLWNGRAGAFLLSHDIDQVRFSTIKGLLKHPWRTWRLTGQWKRALASLRLAGFGFSHPRHDPFFSYYYLLRLYRHLHIRGSFFVIPRRTMRLEPYDLLDEERLIHALTALAARVNAEIGLHATFAGSRGGPELDSDVDVFHKAFAYRPVGARSHYLRFFWPGTLRSLDAAGIQYDSTLGFSGHEGFRCGTCQPFFLFDVERRRATNVLEIPLVLMDATLLYHKRYALPEAREKALALLRSVQTYNGVYTVLWHAESLLCPLWSPWRRAVFLPLLREGLKSGCAFLTGEQINQRCRSLVGASRT